MTEDQRWWAARGLYRVPPASEATEDVHYLDHRRLITARTSGDAIVALKGALREAYQGAQTFGVRADYVCEVDEAPETGPALDDERIPDWWRKRNVVKFW